MPANSSILTFLVNSIWQAPIVTALAGALSWMLRKNPASHRHALWVAALLAAVVAPLASIPPVRHSTQPASMPAVPQIPAAVPASQTTTPIHPAPPDVQILIPVTARTSRFVVLAFVSFLWIRLALFFAGWLRTIHLRRSACSPQSSALVRETWLRCRTALQLEAVDLLSSRTLRGPMMAGALRRSVIIPEALLSETSEDVVVTALGHEAAHAARHDFLVNLLCEFLYLPISFNPVAWILRHGIQRSRELACDEMVADRLLDPRIYARSIVYLATAAVKAHSPGFAMGVFDGDILEERIQRLMNGKRAELPRARVFLAAALSALAICAMLCSALAVSARAPERARQHVVVRS